MSLWGNISSTSLNKHPPQYESNNVCSYIFTGTSRRVFTFSDWLPRVLLIFKFGGLVDEVQVADEIIADFAGTHSDTVVPLEVQFNSIIKHFLFASSYFIMLWNDILVNQSDEKNIRRRVYDALNVLMAMDIIARDKKEIWWKGLPETNMKDLEELKVGKQPHFLFT